MCRSEEVNVVNFIQYLFISGILIGDQVVSHFLFDAQNILILLYKKNIDDINKLPCSTYHFPDIFKCFHVTSFSSIRLIIF